MMRSAVFFPMPLVFERSVESPATTADLKEETGMPLRTARAMDGPMPETRSMRRRKTSRSSSVAKP